MNPFEHLPLLDVFAMAALPLCNKEGSAKEIAEEAYEIADWMLVMHNKRKVAPGVPRLGGIIKKDTTVNDG